MYAALPVPATSGGTEADPAADAGDRAPAICASEEYAMTGRATAGRPRTADKAAPDPICPGSVVRPGTENEF
jgi:hypothetical protein